MASTSNRDFTPALGFDRLTPLFDPVAALTSREGKRMEQVLELAELRVGDAVLDIGCGTGTLAVGAASASPGSEIVGLDADPKILSRARRKAREAGVKIQFDQGFSTELPYPDARFDAVLSTLFFHHLRDSDKEATLREALRVLRPGGRLVVSDLGRPQDPVMRLAVTAVQLLDGRETTELGIGGGLPGLASSAGFADVAVRRRIRALFGTVETLTAIRPAPR